MERSYQNGKIYCIRNTVNKDIYIGSTTQALSRRMVKHRSKAKSEEANHYKIYKLMNSIGVDTFYIEHLVDCPCQSLEHLRAEEGKWIRDMGTLNGRIAGRDQVQRYAEEKETILNNQKQYYKENKEVIDERNKQWRAEHQEEQKEYHKNYREEHKEQISETKKKCYKNKKEEYLKQKKTYYEANKETRNQKKKEYYEKNKHKQSERGKEKIECSCGEIILRSNKSNHLKTKKHQEYINKNN